MRKKASTKILKKISELVKHARGSKDNPVIARRFIARARKLAKRNNLSLRGYRGVFCRKCNSLFVPGKNCKIRVLKGRISIKCLECGGYYRYVYKNKKDKRTKERR